MTDLSKPLTDMARTGMGGSGETKPHSPTPWRWSKYTVSDAEAEETRRLLNREPVRALTNDGAAPILDANGELVARSVLTIRVKRGIAWNAEDETRDANAAFIVRAVNCHDELVTALRELLEADHAVAETFHDRDSNDLAINQLIAAQKAARAALAKATTP
jgi:hypothetical protein